ncbi:hypothetical protein LTV02_32170 [Nocardia yamanashiensis]|uniref:hypothetical protein n=1 Tax=Nocardia yamanashiensis TaxID=209247 RepID=UPI001E31C8CF|nr:hypothetical protein [Nocardia yamanashiensis]UGT40612.1 hypothetical protein LTV02_32170 [Nocardia yamanashiensis]
MKWRIWQVRIAVTAMLIAMPLSVMDAVLGGWSTAHHPPPDWPTLLWLAVMPVLANPFWWLGLGFTICDPLLPRRAAATWYLITPAGALLAFGIAWSSAHLGLHGPIAWTAGALIAFACLLAQSWIVVDMPETDAHATHPARVRPDLYVSGTARIIPFGRPAPLRLVRVHEA